MTELCGVLAPLVNPCKEDDSLDILSLKKQLERLCASQIHGVYLNGGTGDAANLTQQERLQTAEYAVPRLKEAGKLAVVQVGQTNLRCALELSRQAVFLKADAVASVPPQKEFAQVLDYYRALAQTGARIVVYYIPGVTGRKSTFQELCALLELPGVAGIKVSDWDLFMLRRLKRAFPQKAVFSGFDELLLPGLLYGADGCIGTWVNLFPTLYAKVYAYAQRGETAAVLPVTQRFAEFLVQAWKYGVLNTFEELMYKKGFAGRCFRRPSTWNPGCLKQETVQSLISQIEQIEDAAAAL